MTCFFVTWLANITTLLVVMALLVVELEPAPQKVARVLAALLALHLLLITLSSLLPS